MFTEKSSQISQSNTSENMLIEVSNEGICTRVNQATCLLTGFTLEELSGKRFKDFVDLDDGKLKEIEEAIAQGNGVVVNFEGNFKKKDGKTLFILWSAYWSVRNRSLICIGKDLSITEQRLIKANKELNLLNRINDLLRTGIEGNDLLDLACSTIVDEGKYQLAWFGLFKYEADKVEFLSPISKAGFSKIINSLNLDFRAKLNLNDPFLESLKIKIPLHENYKNEFPNISENSKILKSEGVGSALFIPVNFGAQGFGLLNICSNNEKAFDFHEIQILERISENISLSLRFTDSEQMNSQNKWKLSKINSELELLNEVNDIILREKNEERLLNETFELILARSKYKLAWFSWFKKEELHNMVMVPQIIWGETAYAEALALDFSNPLTLKGPTATSALTGKTSVVNSTLSSPEYLLWREMAAKFGIKSSIAICLDINPAKKAIVGLYSGHENAFDEHEIEVLERIMKNLSYALNSIFETKEKEDFRHSLEQSNQQLRDYKFALDKSALVSLTDMNGVILDANENFLKTTGYQKQELVGFTHKLLNSGYHSNAFWKDMWDTILEGKIWYGELRNKSKDGNYYWLDTTIIPIKNEEDIIHQFLAIRYDITANKNLRERNQFISFLVDSSDDSIISLDAVGKIISWNNGAEKIYGFSAADAEGKLLFDLIPCEEKDSEKAFIEKLNNSKKISETFEMSRKRKDGSYVPLSITLSSIEDEEGNVIGISEVARDISKIKEAEIELQKQIKFLKDLSFINSFEIKQEVSKLRSMASFVAENFRDKIEIEDIVVQAKRSFSKLNGSLEKMNELISSPLKRNERSGTKIKNVSISGVCIIDEDENHSRLLKESLKNLGGIESIWIFNQIEEAIGFLVKNNFDESCLIVLDPETERKKGWDYLKKHELLRLKSKVLLISEKPEISAIERAKDYNCVANYLAKPYKQSMNENLLNGKLLVWEKKEK